MSRLSRIVRWRMGKSALIFGTFRRTFAGLSIAFPRAMTGWLLETSRGEMRVASSDAASEFQLDQSVHFDRVFDRDSPGRNLRDSEHDHPQGFLRRDAPRSHVEEHLLPDFSNAAFLRNLGIRFVEFDGWDGLRARPGVEHEGRPFNRGQHSAGTRCNVNGGPQTNGTSPPDDSVIHDSRAGPRGLVDH